jgi:hypothetical protein
VCLREVPGVEARRKSIDRNCFQDTADKIREQGVETQIG